MAYLGAQPNKTLTKTTSQSFNGTGSATAFTLNRAVNTGEELEVFVDNVQQEPGSGKSYTASGTTLTFDEAPPLGTGNVYVIYRGQAEVTTRLEHDANQALSATTGTFTSLNVPTIKDSSGTNTAMTIASSGNVAFSGNVTFYSSDYDSGWITATLLNSYTHYDTNQYGPVRYRKIGNIVNIQGITTQNAANSVIFTLPVGYRPPNQLILAVHNANNFARLDIKQNGDVMPQTAPSSSWISCACTFMVA